MSHSFALDFGLQVHECRCSIRNSADVMCLPLTALVSIRNNDRMMWSRSRTVLGTAGARRPKVDAR